MCIICELNEYNKFISCDSLIVHYILHHKQHLYILGLNYEWLHRHLLVNYNLMYPISNHHRIK